MTRGLLVLLLSTSAAAETRDLLTRRLLAVDTPPTREALVEAGGPATEARLQQLAVTAPASLVGRAALSALAWFPSERTFVLLDGLSKSSADATTRKLAVDALGFGFRGDRRLEGLLRRALTDASPMVRRAAVWALLLGDRSASRALLEAHARVEPDQGTVAIIAEALQQGR